MVWERQVDRPIDDALRCRNYAEELRLIASDKTTAESREALLKVANDYDRMASSFEAIDRNKRAGGLPR
jgi:hypothetical protein